MKSGRIWAERRESTTYARAIRSHKSISSQIDCRHSGRGGSERMSRTDVSQSRRVGPNDGSSNRLVRAARPRTTPACKNPNRGESGPAHRPRLLLPAPGARLRPHARRGLHDLRRPRTGPRRADRGDRRPAASGSPLPAAARARPVRAGPPGVGRRSTLQPAVPRSRHGVAAAGRRGRARPLQAALGAVAGRGAAGRSLRAALEDPPRARGRDLGGRYRDRAVRCGA